MLMQSRSGGLGAQWRQLSKLGRFAVISIAVFFTFTLLWGTGTVDVDYVRNQFKNIPDNHRDEPIPQEKNDSPIIDGVPNDQNDRPIPNGVIEQPEDKHAAVSESVPDKQDAASSAAAETTKAESEKAQKQDATSAVDTKPNEIEPEKTNKQDAATPVDIKPIHTEAAKPQMGPIAGGIPIRVMFIGASMTLGDPPQSAYRMQLREWLVSLGNPVNCVGTARFGHFKDNDVQAFATTPIQILHEKALEAVPEMQPNLIIVNAGSSDCFQEEDWGSAHAFDYTRDLVDFLFEASPRAAVILSTLVTSPDPRFERCIKSINAQIRQVALDVQREGRPLVLSEQHYDQGLPNRVTKDFMKSDEMHPTVEGWEMMGEIYKENILEVDANGWLVAPVANGIMYDGDAERDLEEAQKAKEEQEKKMKAEAEMKAKEEEEMRAKEEVEQKIQQQKAEDEKKTDTMPTTTHARRLRRNHMR
ncbi:carbohydrate esterase family 3 protein [Xylariaceae sp. AK1471]|nr:carbohydrate esterase family 3 protein [Xylariaceae sp. AK1471]